MISKCEIIDDIHGNNSALKNKPKKNRLLFFVSRKLYIIWLRF